MWAAARAGSSAVGSVAVRLPSIGSGGIGSCGIRAAAAWSCRGAGGRGGRVGDAVTVRGGGRCGRRAGGGLRRGASPVDGLGRGGGHWGQSRALGRGKRRRGSTFGAASEVL